MVVSDINVSGFEVVFLDEHYRRGGIAIVSNSIHIPLESITSIDHSSLGVVPASLP